MKNRKNQKPARHRPPTPRLRRVNKRSVAGGPAYRRGREKSCKHQWGALMAKYKKRVVPIPVAKICLKCGEMKVGVQTIRISRFRMAFDGSTKLKIPVGTDMYS